MMDKKETQTEKAELLPKVSSGMDLELAQTRFELTLEKKLTEIVRLKAEL